MAELEFDSLNPYQNIVSLVASDPVELVSMIKAIRTPIKILAVTSYGIKQVAYIVGDVRPKVVRRPKNEIKGETP